MQPLASLKKRAIAFVLDMIIVTTGVFTVWVFFWLAISLTMWILDSMLTPIVGMETSHHLLKAFFFVLSLLMFLVLPALFGYYFARTESSTLQASIGKMFLGLRVVDEEGQRLDIKKAWWRALNKLIPFGFAPAFFNPKRQTLHDKISGTLVISK